MTERGQRVVSEMSGTNSPETQSAAILREPTKPETRIGWWFMRRFRPKTVALRTARNRVVAAAYTASERYDLPELRAALCDYGETQG